jgi:hypothetical protein
MKGLRLKFKRKIVCERANCNPRISSDVRLWSKWTSFTSFTADYINEKQIDTNCKFTRGAVECSFRYSVITYEPQKKIVASHPQSAVQGYTGKEIESFDPARSSVPVSPDSGTSGLIIFLRRKDKEATEPEIFELFTT